MNLPASDIPQLDTAGLWQRFVQDGQTQPHPFRDKADDFLILRLEAYRQRLKLPTSPYRRQVHEIVFVTDGRLERGCDLTNVVLEAGELHLLMASQIGHIESLSADVQGYYCHFSLETIIRLYHKEHMVNELGHLRSLMHNGPVRLSAKTQEAVRTVLERLLDEQQGANDLNLIDAYLVTLCYEIRNDVTTLAPPAGARTKPYELTEQFKRLVLQYISRHPPMAFYADQLGVSPNHLNKSVRQVTGKSASALINEVLLLEAKVQLKHSTRSIGEVADRLGFTDQSYFGRFFKKATGYTPLEFRSMD